MNTHRAFVYKNVIHKINSRTGEYEARDVDWYRKMIASGDEFYCIQALDRYQQQHGDVRGGVEHSPDGFIGDPYDKETPKV